MLTKLCSLIRANLHNLVELYKFLYFILILFLLSFIASICVLLARGCTTFFLAALASASIPRTISNLTLATYLKQLTDRLTFHLPAWQTLMAVPARIRVLICQIFQYCLSTAYLQTSPTNCCNYADIRVFWSIPSTLEPSSIPMATPMCSATHWHAYRRV